MYKCISPSAMGIKTNTLEEGIDVAKGAGFEGLEFWGPAVADLIDQQGLENVRSMFESAGVKPAAFPLPTEWRGDDAKFEASLAELPRVAKAAADLGCRRTMTWILSSSDERRLEENRRFHVQRFTPIAKILAEHGIRVGLEFIGPKTMLESARYPFIHTMHDMLAMGAEIGDNVGLLLDCWHWHTSGATVDDILALRPEQVVYVHVNDAPPGVAMDDYIDNQRALPGATGVIDIRGFLRALAQIGYDGPVTPEPFGNPATWAKQSLDAIWKAAGL
jgi:sugar phosphate isomerase/epimerase